MSWLDAQMEFVLNYFMGCNTENVNTLHSVSMKNKTVFVYHLIPWQCSCTGYSESLLTHRGQVRHICIGNLTIIGSDNGLSPGQRQAIIWTNAGILLIESLGTNFSEMLIDLHAFSLKKTHFKMPSGKLRSFSLGLNVLRNTRICYLVNMPRLLMAWWHRQALIGMVLF